MESINKKTIFIAAITLVIGLLMGWLFFGSENENTSEEQNQEHTENQIWTCSMHPQIRLPEPGQCPICGMDLITLNNESSSDENPLEVKMSPTAMQLANVQTMIISKQKPIKQVRMNGKVQANEMKVFSQSSHLSGRIEKLQVTFTGESVKKGQTLAYLYSPDLVTAQEELFEANKIKENQPGLFQASLDKLKNWKLTESQINKILERGTAQEQFPILADVSGIVTNKKVNLGDYINRGQALFEITNLNTVWVQFDVYESDIPWVKVGNTVTFTVLSLPGENFTGKVSFIDPVINSNTRVASARLEMNNPGMRLKPEMFVQGIIENTIQKQQNALVVPKSAVMWTGERSVVYIKNTSAKGVSFMMREVTLGAGLGDSYIIKEGLEEGEEIAVNGTFSIDAAAQLAGKPSMMNQKGGVAVTGHAGMEMGDGNSPSSANQSSQSKTITLSKQAKEELKPLLSSYLNLKDALVADNFNKALSEAKQLSLVLSKINMGLFKGEEHNVWMKQSSILEKELIKASRSKDIETLRNYFKPISTQVILIFKTFGSPGEPLFIDYCPMADGDKGADWLSLKKEIKNPYFGSKMLKCGEIKEEMK